MNTSQWYQDKKQPLLIIAAAAVVLALIAGVAALTRPSEEEKAAEKKAKTAQLVADLKAASPRINYQVLGSTTQANVTMETPTGTSQQSGIDVPLRTKAGVGYLQYTFSRGDFVYLSAQNAKSSGTVTCRITNESGDVISENTASGGYAIATCKGSAR